MDSRELAEHAKIFGSFAIELSPFTLRKLGGMPVLYMPQMRDSVISGVGSSIVRAIEEIRHLLALLTEIEEALRAYPEADVVVGRHFGAAAYGLQGTLVNQYELSASELKKTLAYLGMDKQSNETLATWTVYLQNMLYPTDDERHNRELSYYRQREWRLVAGLGMKSGPQDRELTNEEKRKLVDIDASFWTKELVHYLSAGSIRFPRIDRTRVIDRLDEQPIFEHFIAVHVPAAVYDQALALAKGRIRIVQAPE
jgi:hypothetical protein